MRKSVVFILLILFLYNNEVVILSSLEALNIWSKNIFTVLFPTFILSDLLLSSGLVNSITKIFGKIFSKIFKTSEYGLYILLISLLSGTPTNAKNLKILYDNNYIGKNDITKIISMAIFFNPLLIIKLTSIKILVIIWISNLLTGFLMRRCLIEKNNSFKEINIPFNLSASIENNINILLNILGTITIFLTLSNIIPVPNTFFKIIISGCLEITNGLNKVNLIINANLIREILYVTFISFGGISIWIQIKSILKDTFINYKYFFISRLLTAIISIFLVCICT